MNGIHIGDVVSVARQEDFVRLNVDKIYLLLAPKSLTGKFYSETSVVSVEDIQTAGRQKVDDHFQIEAIEVSGEYLFCVYYEYEGTPISMVALSRDQVHNLFLTLQLQLIFLAGGAK